MILDCKKIKDEKISYIKNKFDKIKENIILTIIEIGENAASKIISLLIFIVAPIHFTLNILYHVVHYLHIKKVKFCFTLKNFIKLHKYSEE